MRGHALLSRCKCSAHTRVVEWSLHQRTVIPSQSLCSVLRVEVKRPHPGHVWPLPSCLKSRVTICVYVGLYWSHCWRINVTLFIGLEDTHQKEGLYLLHNRETYDFRLHSRRRPVEVDDAGTRSLRINWFASIDAPYYEAFKLCCTYSSRVISWHVCECCC